MPLDNFFRINLPYGLQKDNEDRWTVFNREYLPLSNIDVHTEFVEDETEKYVFTKYSGMTENFLLKIAARLNRDSSGNLDKIWLYSDADDPLQHNTKENWNKYFEKLKAISVLKIKRK